jgi:uncharacterized protein YbjT (DUF2867 family)
MGENRNGLRVTVFGATGVAGGGVLQAWLNDPRVEEVRTVTRRNLGITHEKLREVLCNDFERLDEIGEALTGADALCFCLGISASQVSGEAEYRVITHDYAVAAALALKAASPEATFHFVSGSGTNAKSRMMWARVKGETEQELQQLGLGGIVCWRPGMILADQPPRGLPWSYRAAYPVMRLLSFIPSLSIGAEELGQAMLEATLAGRSEGTLENREIREEAKRYQTKGFAGETQASR